ncbi:unnamed protein product, partial [Heterosigma akashiwo]
PSAPWAFTRAALDVSGFRAFLLAQGEEIWDDDYQARHNVGLTRPAHDNWGIRKVVFVFCDDYLKRVYELPWFHRPEWRQHLDPIFQGIGLQPEKLVRCLLASIPPGVTIPPHHDTGHWVRFTHRVHVAVATHQDVVFRCGPDESNMARVSFDEGRVVELNNQSKHYVHNGWDQYRTHLIFDYVEDFPLERVQLQPGEALTQTRRTVDRAAEAGARPVAPPAGPPSFPPAAAADRSPEGRHHLAVRASLPARACSAGASAGGALLRLALERQAEEHAPAPRVLREVLPQGDAGPSPEPDDRGVHSQLLAQLSHRASAAAARAPPPAQDPRDPPRPGEARLLALPDDPGPRREPCPEGGPGTVGLPGAEL